MGTVIEIINIIGIISFSAAGAMIAIDKENDLFGVILMSVMTCFGGGIMRDMIAGNSIGRMLPVFFTDMKMEIIVCIITALVVFLLALRFKTEYVREEESVYKINNILDALGIGVFTTLGTSAYLELGPFVAVTMGVITAVGGGAIRDVFLRSVPIILHKRVYAIPCIFGGIIYYLIAEVWMKGMDAAFTVATVCCILFIFVMRVLATYFEWDIPKAIDFNSIKIDDIKSVDK